MRASGRLRVASMRWPHNRHTRRLPCGNAAGDVRHVGEALRLEHARRDGRARASLAMKGDWCITWHVFGELDKITEKAMLRLRDVPLVPFIRPAHVENL